MTKKIFSAFLLCMLVSIVPHTIFSDESISSLSSEEVYKKVQEALQQMFAEAQRLKAEGDYDAAYAVLKQLINEHPTISKYQISYTDVLLEQAVTLKESGNPEWKTKAKEARFRLKTNPLRDNVDYWLAYAKYSYIVETKKDRHIHKALDYAFDLQPTYYEAFIVKGDAHFWLAKNSDILEQPKDSVTLTGGSSVSTKHMMAMTARASYESALSDPEINIGRKTYVYYKIGELEYQILGNKTDAKTNWEKAAALFPDGKTGKKAKSRLQEYSK